MPKPPPPDERPTLREMAGHTAGLECPVCGCRDFRVARTLRGDGHVDRVRRCRHCGRQVVTVERLKGS